MLARWEQVRNSSQSQLPWVAIWAASPGGQKMPEDKHGERGRKRRERGEEKQRATGMTLDDQ